jgi:rubredoxin
MKLFSDEDIPDLGVRFCPKCKSHEVTSRGMVSRDMLSPHYMCQTCGYVSAYFPEVSEKEDGNYHPKNFIQSRSPFISDETLPEKNTFRIILAIAFILFLSWLLINY